MSRRFLLDALLLALFALVGRISHAETLTAAGWWQTFWPFGFGLIFGWLLLLRTDRPTDTAKAGLALTAATVLGGMLVRSATHQGTAWPFVVVATLVIGALLIGTRAVPGLRRARG